MLIKVNINNLLTVIIEKSRKYDLLSKELELMYKCKTDIIMFMLTWTELK